MFNQSHKNLAAKTAAGEDNRKLLIIHNNKCLNSLNKNLAEETDAGEANGIFNSWYCERVDGESDHTCLGNIELNNKYKHEILWKANSGNTFYS